MMNKYNVKLSKEDWKIQTIIERISAGQELLSLDYANIDEEIQLKYNNAILLKPSYQREYRFSLDDESSIIESILVDIPIPPVFLASSSYHGIQVLDVVDGQHRLTAIKRFFENKYKLKGLTLLPELNGKYHKDLSFDYKRKILDETIIVYNFMDFPGIEFELAVFNRYNKGTKPLTPQEIRNAVYNSEISNAISSLVSRVYLEPNNNQNAYLFKMYNFTDDRFKKKKVHESIFTVLSILTSGINTSYKDSTVYAEKFMTEMSNEYKSDPEKNKLNSINIMNDFKQFNEWIITILMNMKHIEYPFSREIYGVVAKNKFQPSIAMILSFVFYMAKSNNNIELLYSDDFIGKMIDYINNSYINDPNYNASSTNSKKIEELVYSIFQ